MLFFFFSFPRKFSPVQNPLTSLYKRSRAAIAWSSFSPGHSVSVCVPFLACALTSPLNRDLIEAASQEAVRFGMSNKTVLWG